VRVDVPINSPISRPRWKSFRHGSARTRSRCARLDPSPGHGRPDGGHGPEATDRTFLMVSSRLHQKTGNRKQEWEWSKDIFLRED